MSSTSALCDRCGKRHLIGEFPIGSHVRVTAARAKPKDMRDVPAGSFGVVQEWTQYGCPLSYRVGFDIKDEHGDVVREDYSPCELISIAPPPARSSDEVHVYRSEAELQLLQHIATTEAFLRSCVERRDWHGVSDAANDLRVLEAQRDALRSKP